MPSNKNTSQHAQQSAALPVDSRIPRQLRKHYQFRGDYCAVSGFECIAKLEGLIAPDAFPLQSDSGNTGIGFEPKHRALLEELGVDASEDVQYKSGASASAAIISALDAGRSALISMPCLDMSPKFHVYLCTKSGGETLLIDPAKLEILLKGADALPQALENWRMNYPSKDKTVHVLTYRGLREGFGCGR